MTDANLAVQLYTLRDAGLDFDTLLERVAEAGYDGVETVATHGLPAAEVRAALARHGLRGCSSHVQLADLTNAFDATTDFYLEAGIDTMVVPFLAAEDRPADAGGWAALGERLGRLAERSGERGLALAYHNHDFEFAPAGDATGLAHLLRDSAPLGLELDIGWAVRAGADPRELLSRYAGRVPRVHVKDLRANPADASAEPAGDAGRSGDDEGGWADVGHGRLDWPPLLRAARAAGADWWVVEHDHPRDPVASIRRSAEFLRSVRHSIG